ncbi:MAG: RimK family alpha-L-glutamate ligase [Gammaproteobacteria bacterium]|nr:RimK family alpha-L-glutamate ligase [Gammaproteobacteria bacterium]
MSKSARARVAIVTDDPGWHGRRLREAFRRRGLGSSYVSLTAAALDLAAPQPRVLLPGFEARGPVGVFVRGIPGGTLEQVIQRLDLLHTLALLGIVVYNSGRAIERTVDKAMTSALLLHAGIPTPPTWVCESRDQAMEVARRQLAAGPLVVKPLFGSQGQHVCRIEKIEDFAQIEPVGAVWYLQRFIEPQGAHWCDFRVFVVDGRAVAAMRRSNARHWVTNRAQGARCEAVRAEGRLCELAEAAARALDIDYAGVDLMAVSGGDFVVIEVNGVPAWTGLQRATGVDIGARLADHFVARLAAGGSVEALR